MRMQALGSSYSMVKAWTVQQECVCTILVSIIRISFGINSEAFANSTDNGAELVTDDTSAS